MGKKAASEAGWKEQPKKQANHVTHSVTNPVETAEKVVKSDGMIQPQAADGKSAFVQTCEALRIMLKTTPIEKMHERELGNLRMVERALLTYFYGDKDGRLDLETLVEYYEGQAAKKAA
jgi:hypothetical protein